MMLLCVHTRGHRNDRTNAKAGSPKARADSRFGLSVKIKAEFQCIPILETVIFSLFLYLCYHTMDPLRVDAVE